MKTLRLISLHLQQFQKQTFDLVINGKNANVYGDNGVGKTTLYNALCWLLFDKDSSFKSVFEIKTLNDDGTPQHNLSHEVKGLFRLDGAVIELRKVFTEKWTKKRGQAKQEFTGHETQHYLDGVPVNQTEYKRLVAEIASEDQFKLLTNPFYFPQVMKWQDRRALLMDLCGDIDAKSIAADPRFAPLVEVLKGGRTIEDHRKIIHARRKEVNEALQLLPARIDEVVRSLEDVSGINHLREIDRIKSLNDDLQKYEARIADLKSGGVLADLQRQLAQAENEIMVAGAAITAEQRRQDGLVDKLIADKRRDILDAENNVERIRRNISINSEAADSLRVKIALLVDEWKSLTNIVCSSCPTCGQELPADQLEKIVADSNERNATRKAQIDRQGQAAREQLVSIEAKIKGLSDELDASLDSISRMVEEFAALEKAPRAEVPPPSPELIAAQEKAANLKARIAIEEEGAASGPSPELAEAEESARLCREAIESSQKKIATVEASQKAQYRKAELEREEKSLAAEFEKLEKELFLIDEFTRAKVEILEGQVNGAFKLARFKLFSEQVNGGLSECCSVTYNGVPFETSLNNGARINVGLDIIDTISGKLGLSLPVFIDNAESVTALLPVSAQVVRLLVSENDKKLRVEVGQ